MYLVIEQLDNYSTVFRTTSLLIQFEFPELDEESKDLNPDLRIVDKPETPHFPGGPCLGITSLNYKLRNPLRG